ncbi:flagellar hook-length control protein FliK [Tardiphaga sp. vice352]|uniref:flagellar hook-length control protein FliK n=1 Tax=unclassified Tardiphaga TaxID=2631404 RepID=UPI0011630E6D|nr:MULTISPECIES: flagellar hook-length control protein FliK [unclassified Tardiphaga]QDM17586.1 flagellar hook-length control protein FliK [Tardiphaga sp. vice278]QDM22525.1 flagellar hook-length control protein FliK [Tardiphaga sp. vice154]QDM27812.1 flagellar hook-length control protein FliK [Tardiphaga sp. vice304]QDM32969.1 flagellar hook-length control protein FliK [Tardiphaga sp. vice352]
MVLGVTPVSPYVAVKGVQGDVGFRSGSIVTARVVKLLPDNQVRIAIGNVAVDVSSEVPLQPGQTLQLAVSQAADGVRLAVVTPQPGSTSQAGTPQDSVTLAPEAQLTLANVLTTSKVTLTAPEEAAVSTAAQVAATQQAGLATLFANLGDAAALQKLPLPLQQAVANLLAQRPPLDQNLTGDELKAAFQNSGLFLEASLASGTAPSATMPDMKAALIVFRQLLSSALGGHVATNGAASFVATSEQGMPSAPGVSVVTAAPGTPSPSIMPGMLTPDDVLQQAGLFAVEDFVDFTGKAQMIPPPASSPEMAARVAASGATLSQLQEALQAPHLAGNGIDAALDEGALLNLVSPNGKPPSSLPSELLLRGSVPPPPLRGALPSAQPMPLSTLQPNAPVAVTLHHLLADTDAAIARQTLLQVASLPDRTDATASRLDAAAPRWNFEIPFAMPHGTAVAQFEISRDGGGDSEAEAAQRVWRARFSLDVEPAGPVHALVSLSGDKTSVRLWAERAATAQQLRAGSSQLGQALLRAELQPGDIVIQDGAPVQPAPASAGHFVDRAL